MGQAAQILLVMLALLGAEASAAVEASHYHQFWLWAGVKPQPVLQQAERLYLHQGEIGPLDARQPVRFQGQGIAPSKLPAKELWLAYRVERLDWDEALLKSLTNQLAAWQRKGNGVRGVQIDFDARTHRLADYGDFLRQLRRQLPPTAPSASPACWTGPAPATSPPSTPSPAWSTSWWCRPIAAAAPSRATLATCRR